MKVQILGSSCTKCKTLEERVRQLVAKHQLPIEVEKVTDIQEMIKFGILATPGLVIDGVLKSVGSIPKDTQLLEWMKG
ncbi:MAG: thioredoxin family protein [Ignavibacteriales bacterium]|nr:thioredoxin family protein [Ignavibacteriales bacterium]